MPAGGFFLEKGGRTLAATGKNRKLTPKQERFIHEYLKDCDATKAAGRAGYKGKHLGLIGHQLLKNSLVGAAVSERRKKIIDRLEVTQEKIVREYAKLGFSDMADYVNFEQNGRVHFDWSELPEGASAAVQEITQEEAMDGAGDEARKILKTKFKLHDKKGALDSLSRHLGLFADKLTVDANVSGGLIAKFMADPEDAIATAKRLNARRGTSTDDLEAADRTPATANGNGHTNGNGNGVH